MFTFYIFIYFTCTYFNLFVYVVLFLSVCIFVSNLLESKVPKQVPVCVNILANKVDSDSDLGAVYNIGWQSCFMSLNQPKS